MRTSARTLQTLTHGLDAVFVTPPNIPDDAPNEDFELAVDVDQLQSTVVGGLTRTSITTGAVLAGRGDTRGRDAVGEVRTDDDTAATDCSP